MFDEDEAGQKAARECADLLSPGKAAIAKLSRKDANEMLVNGEVKQIATSVFEAMPNWPVVSIKSGAAGAKRSFKENIEYLES